MSAAKAKEGGEAEGKAEGKAKGKGKMLPIIIGVVVLLGVFLGKGALGGGKGKGKEKKEVKAELGISLPLDEFMVNLSGGNDHYLRANIALGLKKGLTEEQGKEASAPMRDAILSVLRAKTIKDFETQKEIDALKAEIKEKVNHEAEGEPVVKVYFTGFATQ